MQDKDFLNRLLTWYDENPRELPWKSTDDQYLIWLSEIIMQQTRVNQGTTYYNRFKELFPTIYNLANADLKEVIKAWEGLGYYSRARNLHETAKNVAYNYNGVFPDDYNEIQKLKGIGPYTGAAILSFAKNKAIPAIDGNAYRVLSRVFGIEDAIDISAGKKRFFTKGEKLIALEKERAGDYNQAMMNFGATICTPKAAKCDFCVMQDICVAYKTQKVNTLPIKSKKIKYKQRFFTFFCIQFEDQFLINERKEKDVWQNLYQFHLVESSRFTSWEKVIENDELLGKMSREIKVSKVFKENQTLTHQKLSAEIVWVKLANKPYFFDAYQWVNGYDILEYPFPKMLQNVIKLINLEFRK